MARCGFPMARGGGQDLPAQGRSLGEGLPTRRKGERICPAQEHAPRQRHPDTAHERKGLPRAGALPTAKASRHGARAKGLAPRRNTPRGEGLPTRHTGERICPAQERSPRRKPPDTAHGRKDLSRAGTLPSAKASRHGARAKGLAPRRNTPRGEGLPTRHTGERICPAGFAFAPRADERRAAPDRRTAGKTPLRRGRTRHGARAKGFAPRGSPSPHVPTNGGPPSTDGQPKNTPSAGSHPRGRGRCRVHSPKKNKTTP